MDLLLDAVPHRGPDGRGVWSDENERAFLGHRRLSINDLNAGGVQPMISSSVRNIITFNGEIYNYLEKLLSEFRFQEKI